MIPQIPIFLKSIPSLHIYMALLAGSTIAFNKYQKYRDIHMNTIYHSINSIVHNINLIDMNSQNILPSYACYKMQCHDSSKSWLCYQSSLTQLRLLNFNKSNVILESFTLSTPVEPIKSIRIISDKTNNNVYVAIVFLSKFMVLLKNQLINQYSLSLNQNIVEFESGFSAVEAIFDGKQIYFVFVTSKGQFITLPAESPQNRTSFQININKRVSGLSVKDANAYLGTQNGQIVWVDMNSRKLLGKYDTKSGLPIINMKFANQYLVLATCTGQLHILTSVLDRKRIISAHCGMINEIFIEGSKIVTSGQDSQVSVWKIQKEGNLENVSQKFYGKRVNMVFGLNGKTYLNFYEQSKFQEI